MSLSLVFVGSEKGVGEGGTRAGIVATLGQRSACLPLTPPIGGEARGVWGRAGGRGGHAGANGVEGGGFKVEFVEFNHELRDILTSVRIGLVVLPLSESDTGVSSRSLLLLKGLFLGFF